MNQNSANQLNEPSSQIPVQFPQETQGVDPTSPASLLMLLKTPLLLRKREATYYLLF